MADIGLETLKTVAAAALIDQLNGIIHGGANDIAQFGAAIAHSAAEAGASGDTQRLQQLADQSKLLLEINRLRIAQGAEKVVSAIINAIASITFKLAAAAVISPLA